MSTQAATDIHILYGEFDFTGQSNQFTYQIIEQAFNSTTFGDSGVMTRIAASSDASAQITGFIDEELHGLALFAGNSLDRYVQACRQSPTLGDEVHVFKGTKENYEWGGAVGSGRTISIPLVNLSNHIMRGNSLMWKTSTGAESGSGYQFGTVASTETLFGICSVTEFSGTTATVKVQRDIDNTWTTPTDLLTFSAFTDVGYDEQSSAGAQTEEWYRADVSGTFTSMKLSVVIAKRTT